MKCPYRVNTRYPAVAGENWSYQETWNDCEENCPFFLDGGCLRVGAVLAEKAYYEAAILKLDEE